MISILVPCFNEKHNIAKVLEALQALRKPYQVEVIVIDDGSTDGSADIIRSWRNQVDRVILHKKNFGKGAAIRTGLREAKGSIIAIQDADLEYNVTDLLAVIDPVRRGHADFCLGNRFHEPISYNARHMKICRLSLLANHVLSKLTSLVTGTRVPDVESCYKVFKRDLIKADELDERGFGIEPELTIKLIRRCRSFMSIPIGYTGRTKAEGKKIRFSDGWRALYAIARYGLKTS